MFYFWLTIALFLIAVIFVSIKGECLTRLKPLAVVSILLILAAIRFYLASFTNGYRSDFALFTNWAIDLQTIPFQRIYIDGHLINYRPIYLYVLWLIGKIATLANVMPISIVDPWNMLVEPFSTSWVMMLKTVPILADTALACLAYHIASRVSSRKNGIWAAFLVLICPAVGMNSLLWAQTDSFPSLILVVSLIFLGYAVYNKKTLWWTLSAVAYMTAVLTKPQTMIFAPVFLAAIAFRFKIKPIIISVGVAVLAAVVICFPFSNGNIFLWIYDMIRRTTTQDHQIAVNAYNLYYLLGLNLKDEISPVWGFVKIAIPTVLTAITFILWGASLRKNEENPPAKILTVNFWLGFLLMFTVFMFMPEMHERYSYPALICLYFAFASSGNRRILPLIAMISITLFANCTGLLSVWKLGGNTWRSMQFLFNNTDIGEVFSFVNVIAWAYGVIISWGILKERKTV